MSKRTSDTSYVITPPPVVGLPVTGQSQRFPVNRVFCIGRNYAAHAVEMGHDPDRDAPFFFLKSASAVTTDGVFPYPAQSHDVHHELEMVVALSLGGRSIPVSAAEQCIFGYGIGLDMTCRDLQGEAKQKGRPWEVGKSFEYAAPCGFLTPASEVGHPAAGELQLTVNGEIRQQGDLNQMIWKVPEIIARLSDYFELQPGDIIMTGTPSGVGPVQRGDRLHGRIAGLSDLNVTVA